MNMTFLPKTSLKQIFPISQSRASHCSILLKDKSENYKKPVNMSDFFLNSLENESEINVESMGETLPILNSIFKLFINFAFFGMFKYFITIPSTIN